MKIKTAKQLPKVTTIFHAILIALVTISLYFGNLSLKASAENIQSQIDSALYKHEEFFGAQANVPVPTAEAYQNLLKIDLDKNPILLDKLAEFAEKNGKFGDAEHYFQVLNDLEKLASFYDRRAAYAQEAETLNRLLQKGWNPTIFENLINLARLHELNQYLEPQFFQQFADQNANTYSVLERLIDSLVEEKETAKALEIIRKYKSKYPEEFLEKEVALVSPKEAENIYYQSFDPFWSDSEAENFYQFLNDNDRLRAYGRELTQRFRQNMGDFETAVRLIHYRKYRSGDVMPVILQLDRTKKTWKAEELLTIARFLLVENSGDLATRYLYTLTVRKDYTPAIRAKILYEIFRTLCSSESESLSITKGDLSFYRDVARIDVKPGIMTGILSLFLSDLNPDREMKKKESSANKYFNRAMALEVLQSFKKEFPLAPEIGSMYLDLISLYTNEGQTETAEKLLNEFTEIAGNSRDFPDVALNLANAYLVVEKFEQERDTYQKILDYLGREGKFRAVHETSGVNVENLTIESGQNSDVKAGNYRDLFAKKTSPILYESVLHRLINSFAKDKNTEKILAIYSAEIAKYPQQEWLYEERLKWLEQTNLVGEQLHIYQVALEKFQTNNWRDKLARWFLRQKQNAEFVKLSEKLVASLEDKDVESYFSTFDENFDTALKLNLLVAAHQRFPHRLYFIEQLLNYYQNANLEQQWRELAAEYYFEFPQIREKLLDDFARKGQLRLNVEQESTDTLIGQLFKADGFVKLSRFEDALAIYRQLNNEYPNDLEISERMVNLTRSFGQTSQKLIEESSQIARQQADFAPSNRDYRTRSGEISAELGDYVRANRDWRKLLTNGSGSADIYLETATVYWDYFQYREAIQVINEARTKFHNPRLYAIEAGVIYASLGESEKAIAEYLSAFGEDESMNERAIKGLIKLPNNEVTMNLIEAEFARQWLDWTSFGCASFAKELQAGSTNYDTSTVEKVSQKALNNLHRAIAVSKNEQFLRRAQDSFQDLSVQILKRLSQVTGSPRKSISYSLQIAEIYRRKGQSSAAQKIISALLEKYPRNYGLIAESDRFFWSLGKSDESVRILRGAYETSEHEEFGLPLADRYLQTGRLKEAESILIELHRGRKEDSNVFQKLANVYLRENQVEKLHTIFAENLEEIRAQDIEPEGVEQEVADQRRQMIPVFTQAKDYRAAIEQHIEIINRDPENEENVTNAISYIKRYGNGDLLVNYYQKTANEAFKNYRWNIVLAKIFEALGQMGEAVINYRKAIDSQPEMPELYGGLSRLETLCGNYDNALEDLDMMIKRSGENVALIKKRINLLKLLKRFDEAEIETAKIPAEDLNNKPKDIRAKTHPNTQIAPDYASIFEELKANPLKAEITSEEICGYVAVARINEGLDVISDRLLKLRQIYLDETQRNESTQSGEARKRLNILDAAMRQSIGKTADNFGTADELANLHNRFSNEIESNTGETLNFYQDLSASCAFGDLVEKALQKRGDIDSLVSFYNERGLYQKILEIVETRGDAAEIATYAKLVGNQEKEVAALRKLYSDPKATDELIQRYFEIAEAKELEALSEGNSVHQLKLINFLIEKGRNSLAHTAIENSNFGKIWKLSRHAEVSLVFNEFGEMDECYFCDALNLRPIGELINSQPSYSQQLTGKDWFALTKEYGEWLGKQNDVVGDKYVVSGTEYVARNAEEQAKLGDYFLAQKEFAKSLEHYSLSYELDEKQFRSEAKIAEIYWNNGDHQKAEKLLENVFQKDLSTYIITMKTIGLEHKAIDQITETLVKKLKDGSNDFSILKDVAQLFGTEKEKEEFFIKLCELSENKNVAKTIIAERLIETNYQDRFYDFILRGNQIEKTNYRYTAILQEYMNKEDAEEIYDHEKNFEEEANDDSQTSDEHNLDWSQKYLNHLLENHRMNQAKTLIINLETQMQQKRPRPVWLRLAHIQVFGGNLKKFVGIEVSGAVLEAKSPSLERLVAITSQLEKNQHQADADQLRFAFYARMLARHEFETANFIGLSREFFKNGDTENGLKVLRIMTDFKDEKAQKELSEMPVIKEVTSQVTLDTDSFAIDGVGDLLEAAATICEEYKQNEAAESYRNRLLEVAPNDSQNKLEFAKLLQNSLGFELLQNIISDKNASRKIRWEAIWMLRQQGEQVDFSEADFDVFWQYDKWQTTHNQQYLANSLVIDKNVELPLMQQLAKDYLTSNEPFAVLNLARSKSLEKNDEMLSLYSDAAEKVDSFAEAIAYESAKTLVDRERLTILNNRRNAALQRATDLRITTDSTRGL